MKTPGAIILNLMILKVNNQWILIIWAVNNEFTTPQDNQPDTIPNDSEEVIIRRSTHITKPPSYLQAYHCSLLTIQPQPTQKSTRYPINQYLTYQAWSPSYKHSIIQTSIQKEHSFYHEAVLSQEWRRIERGVLFLRLKAKIQLAVVGYIRLNTRLMVLSRDTKPV